MFVDFCFVISRLRLSVVSSTTSFQQQEPLPQMPDPPRELFHIWMGIQLSEVCTCHRQGDRLRIDRYVREGSSAQSTKDTLEHWKPGLLDLDFPDNFFGKFFFQQKFSSIFSSNFFSLTKIVQHFLFSKFFVGKLFWQLEKLFWQVYVCMSWSCVYVCMSAKVIICVFKESVSRHF